METQNINQINERINSLKESEEKRILQTMSVLVSRMTVISPEKAEKMIVELEELVNKCEKL